MNYRKYKTDKDELIGEVYKYLMNSKDSKFTYKLTLVSLVLNGMSVDVLSQYTKYRKETISRWVKAVDEGRILDLRDKKKTGRPNKLSDNQLMEIDEVLQKDPESLGYNVWDGSSLSAFIKKKFDVDYSVRQSQRLFHKLNFLKKTS